MERSYQSYEITQKHYDSLTEFSISLPAFKGEDYVFKAFSAGRWMIGKWTCKSDGTPSFEWFEPKIVEEKGSEDEKAV